jgi:Uncharacterised nucleotidyltransferase
MMASLAGAEARGNTLAHGETVAAVLAGAWRLSPPPLELRQPALEAIVPLLASGGAGGLAWHRLREKGPRISPAGRELRQHYRMQTLQAVEREEAIRELLPRLRTAGVEPILIKGWSSALLYPEAGLRPSCDVDLCVPPDRLETGITTLSGQKLPCAVDLHRAVPDLPDRTWDEVFRRSRLVALNEIAVRVLGPEDQLRLLCLHLARHGIARPLWLCDIGACLESLPAAFDWDYCLWGRKHLSSWTACVLGLAHRLLHARLPGGAATEIASAGSPWIERAVHWCWGGGPSRPLRHYLRRPAEVFARLRYQGISCNRSTPIKAAYHLGLEPVFQMPSAIVQLLRLASRKVPHVFRRLGRPRITLPFTVHDR